MSWKSLLAAAAAGCILAGGFESHFVRMFTIDRAAYAKFHEELPYRKLPGFRCFVEDVRAATRQGDHVALLLPDSTWKAGYEYAYQRAVYLLAGRTVEPLIDRADRFHGENLAVADHVACWHCDHRIAGFALRRELCAGVLSSRR